jgi:hypothetical protein
VAESQTGQLIASSFSPPGRDRADHPRLEAGNRVKKRAVAATGAQVERIMQHVATSPAVESRSAAPRQSRARIAAASSGEARNIGV